jgi:hypothetical protein
MRSAYKGLVCIVALFAVAAVASVVTADTESVTVPASGTQAQNLGDMSKDDLLSISWTSDHSVSAVLTGPSGYSKTYSSSIFGYDLLNVPHDGAYVLTFTNPGSSSATVTLTWEVTPFNPVHTATDILTWIAIIAVIIIVVIVVIVVLVVVMGGKKKKAEMAAAAPQGIVTPTTPGMCPICGAQTDTNALFCAKCGARFR